MSDEREMVEMDALANHSIIYTKIVALLINLLTLKRRVQLLYHHNNIITHLIYEAAVVHGLRI